MDRKVQVEEAWLRSLADKAETLLKEVEELPSDVYSKLTSTSLHQFIGYASSAKTLAEQGASQAQELGTEASTDAQKLAGEASADVSQDISEVQSDTKAQ